MGFMKLFGSGKKLPIMPLKTPNETALPPVRSMTLPNGKVVKVMREDVFQKSIRPKADRAA